MWLRKKEKEKKNLKSLIRFHSANKIDNYNGVGVGRTENKRKSKRFYRAKHKNKSKHKNNVFLGSLLSEPFPSLGVTVHLTSLGCPPTLLISGPVLGAAQILIRSYSSGFFKCPQLSELVHFLLWELSVTCYIFHRHSLPSWSCGFNL